MYGADFPLEQMKTYMGTNPCPADFDAYWQTALKEMNSVDPDFTLTKADFSAPFADCYDFSFIGVRGARVTGKFLKPQNISGKIPAILQFHGYNCTSGEFSSRLNYVAAGFAVAVMNCRGQSGMSEDTGAVKGLNSTGQYIRGIDDDPQNMTYRHIMLDTAELAKIVFSLDYIDQDRVYACGFSQGGGLTLACSSLEPRIKKAAPVYPFLCDYQRVWQIDPRTSAYDEIRHYFRTMDPMHKREEEVFTKLGYLDVKNMVKWIKADVLFTTALSDDMCPPSTQFAAYNRITSRKEHLLLPDFGHEYLPGIDDCIWEFFVNDKMTF